MPLDLTTLNSIGGMAAGGLPAKETIRRRHGCPKSKPTWPNVDSVPYHAREEHGKPRRLPRHVQTSDWNFGTQKKAHVLEGESDEVRVRPTRCPQPATARCRRTSTCPDRGYREGVGNRIAEVNPADSSVVGPGEVHGAIRADGTRPMLHCPKRCWPVALDLGSFRAHPAASSATTPWVCIQRIGNWCDRRPLARSPSP